jgi:hypothetical protein
MRGLLASALWYSSIRVTESRLASSIGIGIPIVSTSGSHVGPRKTALVHVRDPPDSSGAFALALPAAFDRTLQALHGR